VREHAEAAPAVEERVSPAVPGGAGELAGVAAAIGNRAFAALVARGGIGARGAPAGDPRQALLRRPATARSPEETEADEKLKAEFRGRTFSKPTHEPGVGGRFGIAYAPASGTVTVTVRIGFNFVDFPEELARAEERRYCRWKAAEKERWTREFCTRIAERWSGKHVIRCTKDGWGEFVATPAVRVEPAEGEAHYTVNVHKDLGGRRVRAGVDPDTHSADLSEGDVKPESEVASGEAKIKETEIIAREKARLEAALGALGGRANPITFAPGSVDVPPAARDALWAFGRALSAAGPSAPRFPVQVVGESRGEDPGMAEALARRRGDTVGTIINGTSKGYPLRVSARASGDGRRATVGLGEQEAGWSDQYSVAEHEFGHMLGNVDEYRDAEHVHDEAKKGRWTALVRSAGVSVPMEGEEASTSSQMSKGTDVLPAHYVTIWEALGELTDRYVTRSEWSID
jgi:hypothetical protein